VRSGGRDGSFPLRITARALLRRSSSSDIRARTIAPVDTWPSEFRCDFRNMRRPAGQLVELTAPGIHPIVRPALAKSATTPIVVIAQPAANTSHGCPEPIAMIKTAETASAVPTKTRVQARNRVRTRNVARRNSRMNYRSHHREPVTNRYNP
jgi:hypothetical protein